MTSIRERIASAQFRSPLAEDVTYSDGVNTVSGRAIIQRGVERWDTVQGVVVRDDFVKLRLSEFSTPTRGDTITDDDGNAYKLEHREYDNGVVIKFRVIRQ